MKRKLFFLTTILSVGLFIGCDNEYMLDDPSDVTPSIEIAAEDATIRANNGATVQLKASIANPNGLSTVVLSSDALGVNEEIAVNAPSYTLSKEITIPANTQAGVYLVNVTANSKNLLTITKQIKIQVGNETDDTAPVIELLSETEIVYDSTIPFYIRNSDNLGLESLKVWSDDIGYADSLDLNGIQVYEYQKDLIIPAGYKEETITVNARLTDQFGNVTLMTPAIFKVNAMPGELFLVGGSSPAGWTPELGIPFERVEDGQFRLFSYLTTAGDGLKLLPQREKDNWSNDWGMKPDEPGKLVVDDEANIPVPEDGFYAVNIDFNTTSYELLKMQFGIVGDFNGWGTAKLMDFNPVKGNYTFTITQEFTAAGAFKFKWDKDDDWTYNFGAENGNELSAEAVFKGNNINIPEAGTYDIELNLDPEGYSYSIVKK